jgi:acyl-homoserine-lactone acylase
VRFVNGMREMKKKTGRRTEAWRVCLGLLAIATASHAKAPAVPAGPTAVEGVEIRRTTDGIPHVRAHDWGQLGKGVGYAQAQDALCTLAEAFVTYEGRRAWFFGAEAVPARDSTFGRPKNIDLDFFFRAFADDAVLANYRTRQPGELNEMVEGFAAGYNRYLADARQGRVRAADRPCLAQDWVRDITADDVHRRMYAAQIAAGYAKFVTEIANARPASPTAPPAGSSVGASALGDRLAHRIGTQSGIGSNVFAFGNDATGGDGAVLFGNPHWYWGGPDRFYQMHLSIPGRLDVAGAAFLGVPVVMIGFNADVAWSHTVSEARRFGLFDLTLDASDPTRYEVDGRSEAMTAREVAVEVRDPSGGTQRLTRTFYRTRFGPVIDLGARNPAFGWGNGHAMVMRDVNEGNFRVFSNFFFWNQARSLDEFIAIQRREAAVPWVNTAAIGRAQGGGKDGRAWYGDVGAAPDAPDDLRQACTTPRAEGFAQVDPLTPVLDGSRSACDWRADPAAAQPGALPAAAMPSLIRSDYVANMNNSYWLPNVHQTLEGFPSLLGGEGQPLWLRARLGHRMALERVDAGHGSAEALSRRLMREVLTPRAHSAERFKGELLAQACGRREVLLDAQALNAAGLDDAAPRKVDIGKACEVLRRWPNKADAGDRGVLLWEAFWARAQSLGGEAFYAVPFARDAPLDTPAKPQLPEGRAAQVLAATVLAFGARGWPLDGALGRQRFVLSGGQRFPLYGGCDDAGYFTVACNEDGSQRMGPDTVANSYLQVVRFDADGVRADTLLSHGQDETAVSGGRGAAPVARYARKAWLRFPFREEDIARDPNLRRTVLRP